MSVETLDHELFVLLLTTGEVINLKCTGEVANAHTISTLPTYLM